MVAAQIKEMPVYTDLSIVDSQDEMTQEMFEEISRALEATKVIDLLASAAGEYELAKPERQNSK
jgi:hypothetical protein